MRILPISFTGAMINAIMDGRKTQTRRVLGKLQGLGPITEFGPSNTPGYDWHCRDRERRWHDLRAAELRERLPYAVGDLLYVRESWRTQSIWDDKSPSDLMVSNGLWPGHDVAPLPRRYEADGFETGVIRDFSDALEMGRLRAAMHMPRRLSRLTLNVSEVRIQRIQQISEADAKAEGLAAISKDGELFKFGIPDRDGYPGNDDYGWHWADWEAAPRDAFRKLWDSINAPRGLGWAANPWVVAITFDVYRGNVDELIQRGVLQPPEGAA